MAAYFSELYQVTPHYFPNTYQSTYHKIIVFKTNFESKIFDWKYITVPAIILISYI